MAPRIAIGGIEHETCGFSADGTDAGTTDWESFELKTLRGNALHSLGEANTIVDGFMQGVRACNLAPVPLMWIDAVSGGAASRDTFEKISSELYNRLEREKNIDGVLLSLHGSFAAEGIDDADGAILEAVRERVGPQCPVMAVHDLHCNLTEQMANNADALIVERTYPHIDMAERGIHAAQLMADTIAGTIQPEMGFCSLPLLWSAPCMITAESPMREAIEQLKSVDQQTGILSSSIGVGYQWIDSPVVGTSTVVVSNGNPELAQQQADQLGQWIWEHRAMWQREPLSVDAAIARGQQRAQFPIILAEQGDNTGGGAAGDATEILRFFIEQRLSPSALLYLVDPETAAQASSAGQGAEITVQAGGKSAPSLGPPVTMHVKVRAVSDGKFTYDGPMWKGVSENLGPSAWLEQNGVHVIVISRRCQPIDLAFCRTLGLDCTEMQYLAIKSTGHFRSGFAPIAGSIFNVDTASSLSHDFNRLPYTRLGRKMYPRDQDTQPSWQKPSSTL